MEFQDIYVISGIFLAYASFKIFSKNSEISKKAELIEANVRGELTRINPIFEPVKYRALQGALRTLDELRNETSFVKYLLLAERRVNSVAENVREYGIEILFQKD